MTHRFRRVVTATAVCSLTLGASAVWADQGAGQAAQNAALSAPGALTPAMLGQLPPPTPATTPPPAEAEKPKEPEWPSKFFRSLTFAGYVETSYTFNFSTPHNGNENVARIFDTNSNEFMLNQVAVDIEKPVDKDHPVGFKVTPFAGQDAAGTQAIGLFKGTDGVSDTDFDLLNAYIQAMCPSTETKLVIGKFETTAGAEVIHGVRNDNFSRSFLFGFAIPFTHTGLYVAQPLPFVQKSDGSSALTATAGIVNGWDNVKDLNEEKMILTNLTFTPSDVLSVAGNFFYSFSEQDTDTPVAGASHSNGRTLYDFVVTLKPIDDLKLLGNLDIGTEEGGSGEDGGYANWWGFSVIARYDFAIGDVMEGAKNFFVAARGEYFADPDAARMGGITGGTGVDVWETTVTLGLKPWGDSILFRTELRYDKADENIFNHDSSTAAQSHQTTLAFEAAFIF